jgi:hypothetical protein
MSLPNPTPNKRPVHKYSVTKNGLAETGFFVDESAARQYWHSKHSSTDLAPPVVTMLLQDISPEMRT